VGAEMRADFCRDSGSGRHIAITHRVWPLVINARFPQLKSDTGIGSRTSTISLPAKLTRPRLAQVYARARLFELLDQAIESSAVWVEAAPGAGKTTLAASWVDVRRRPCVWYQVRKSKTKKKVKDTSKTIKWYKQIGKRETIAKRGVLGHDKPLLDNIVNA